MKIKRYLTWLILLLMSWVFISCYERMGPDLRASKADSILFDVGARMEYDSMLVLINTYEEQGLLSQLNANRWRGVAYYHQGHYRMSEIYYRKAIECEVKSDEDQLSYNKCARRLSELLLVKGDFEGSLQVAIPAVKKMDKTGIGSDIDYAILLNNIGCCQLNLGQDDEAKESFLTARGHYVNRWQSDSTSRGFQEAVLGTVYTSMAYINTRRYAESIYWIDRTEMLLDKYRQKRDARKDYFDEYQGRIEIMRAIAKQGLGRKDEAEEAYRAFLKTDYAKTGPGHINANDYLVMAERYREAADNYMSLDATMEHWGMEPSLDNIQLYMLPKYRANREAGRRDSARVAAEKVLNVLDSAITGQKNSSTAELATLYDTQGKEQEILQQQADLSRQRMWATAVSLLLIIVFLLVQAIVSIICTIVRRKKQQKRNTSVALIWHSVNAAVFAILELALWYFVPILTVAKFIPAILVFFVIVIYAWKGYRENEKRFRSFLIPTAALAVFDIIESMLIGDFTTLKALIILVVYAGFLCAVHFFLWTGKKHEQPGESEPSAG